MITRIAIDDPFTTFVVEPEIADGAVARATVAVPCGPISLVARHLAHDPPWPEELTNAIGEMRDHLDDALRELPLLEEADGVVVDGPMTRVVAAVEHGGSIDRPTFTLTREAAEEVFRTLATEAAAERALNPGLPAQFVDVVVGGCCALVALMRGLHLDVVTVDMGSRTVGS